MSSSNNITIKLDISVPTGLPGTQVRMRRGDILEEKWVGVSDPDTGTNYAQECDICVETLPDTNLGAVAIRFTFDTSKTNVAAVAYPVGLAHDEPSPPDLGNVAKQGVSTNGGLAWTWSGANKLRGADYSTVSHSRKNKLYLWTSTDNGVNWVADTPALTFYGVTGGSCGGSGSGPSGSGLSGSSIGTLPGRPNLKLRVPAGSSAGEHTARCIGSLQWEVVIGGTPFLINLSPDGSAAFLTCTTTGVRAKSAGLSPYCAVFPGTIFGTGGDVMVWQE